MPRQKPNRRFNSSFTLGGEQAEADPLLESGYYESGHFRAISARDDERCFLIGRTGGGKSAVLQHLYESSPEHTIRINPEDLSLPYIVDLGAIKYLAELGVHLDPLFIALWKHVLLVEIIKHRYQIDGPAAKQNFVSALRERIMRDPSKRAALDYLEDFDGRFWCETDVRVRDITKKFEEQIQAGTVIRVGCPPASAATGLEGATTHTEETRAQEVERFQRIVNETQLPRLNKMMSVLDEDILESAQHFTYVVIDDLDRDWVDDQVANDLIRCLSPPSST